MAAYSTPGYMVLYKTVIQPRYWPLYNETGALADIRTLYSRAPSDFSGGKSLIYLTSNVEVVEYQASYIRRRAEHTPTGVVCLCIPTNALKTMPGDGEESCVQHLSWPSNNWRELVWYSRTRTLPPRLSRYEDAALIVGPMAWGPRLAFAALDPGKILPTYFCSRWEGVVAEKDVWQFSLLSTWIARATGWRIGTRK